MPEADGVALAAVTNGRCVKRTAIRGASRPPSRCGYTMAEVVIVIVIIGLLAAIALPAYSRWIQSGRLDAAQAVVASDLQVALSAAGRQRRPVRVSWDSTAMAYTISDRVSGTALQVRPLGVGSEFSLTSVRFIPATVEIFPGGTTSAALTVVLSWNGSARLVVMTMAGLVRRP